MLIGLLFLSKAIFIKKNFVISIFCVKNRTTIKVLFFLEFVRLYHNEQCHHARGKLVPDVFIVRNNV